MAAHEVPLLNLFDSFWFEHAVFSSKPHAVNNPSLQLDKAEDHALQGLNPPSGLPALMVRSVSDQFLDTKSSLFSDSSFSPHSVLPTMSRKLQTIPSGKEVLIDEVAAGSSAPLKNSKKKVFHGERSSRTKKQHRSEGSSKSLSDLEFDELKGFMDLGFVFTEEANKDSKLVSIIPGLQRLGSSDEFDDDKEDSRDDDYSRVISRPYLSEAWDALEFQRKEEQLINWRVPSANLDKDMKHHLRFWAHTVASTVR